MDDQEYKSLILYYGREKYYHLMQNTSIEAMTKFPTNKCFRLFNGFALVLGNRIQEGIRELSPIQSEPDVSMGAILGLIYAHKRCTVVDKDALHQFDSSLKEERKNLTSNSAYYAAVFLLLSGKYEKSRDYAEKSLKLNRDSVDAMVLKGWSELVINSKINKTTLGLFERALTDGAGGGGGKNIDANLGQMKYHQINNDFETAIAVLNKLSVRYPNLNIPLVEKMKTQLASWNWDHALETAGRILNLEPTNIEALRIKCLILICRDGNYSAGLACLHILYDALATVEPTNCDLYLQISQLFSRVCGRNMEILEFTTKFIEKAVQMSPGNADYLTELGYNAILLGRYKEATKLFRAATKLDDSSVHALCGLTLCQMAESGPTEQASQQIEFLNEIQGTTKNSLLLFLSGKLAYNNVDKAIAHLVQACEIQFKNLKTIPYGAEYLLRFDPDFLLQVINELMIYSPAQSSIRGVGATVSRETIHISLKHSLNILEAIVKACPGLVPAVFLLAKVEFLCGEISNSIGTLQRILQELDPAYSNAHLLIAQIHIQQNQYPRAAQSLDICLSHNFRIRENPLYHLLNGVIKKNQQQYEEAIKCYSLAMNINGVDKKLSPSKGNLDLAMNQHRTGGGGGLSISDKVTLYLELIETYTLINQTSESARIMQMALDEFANTTEEGRLIIANAELALQQGDVNKVIELLKNFEYGQPYYLLAKTKLADIYLHHKKDRLAFTQCFKELVDNWPGPESYLMLGDAYMSIQESDDAIDAFKKALRLNPSDPLLASKLGRAYVKTHQYKKAISYYKEAVLHPENSALKLDLAELFLKLKQYSNAEQALIDEIDSHNMENEDLSMLQTRTKQLLLLARIRERAGHLNSSLSTLKEARDNQYRLQKRISLDQSGGMQEQHNILAKICMLMTEQATSLRDNQQAIQHNKEALKYAYEDLSAMVSLARLYMQINDMDECRRICETVLENNPNNEAASVMMADLSFRQLNFDNAAYHFSQLLLAQPMYWTALARLIEVMRRSATIHEATPFLQRAEQSCLQPDHEAGLNYCRGLFDWYTGNPNGALRHFNNSRRDTEWGQQSIYNMIEVCMNPDGDLPNENFINLTEGDSDLNDSRMMALKTAERLLHELKPRPGGLDNEALNVVMLKHFLSLASRNKVYVEIALVEFTNLASKDEYKDQVGPIYGLATAYILLKQSQRARTQLKRVAKNQWTFEDAEYLERCWLLLADLYIQSNKNELAQELLRKILNHNKSCFKAHELCGLLHEKEQLYRQAAINYDSAWRFGGRTKPAIGYKLAFNHMKSKRFADAIDVCQQVLKLHPDYPAIKKDILDKCRSNLRS